MFTINEKEKISVKVFPDYTEANEAVAQRIVELIKSKNAQGKPCILGLATGSTPIKLYARLVELHREGKVSFANVITFNLDEYYPMKPDALQSYHRFMHEYLFNHVDIKPENINIPDGTIPVEKIQEFCQKYDQKIKDLGGIDLQILGVGRTGHIGFNEPGSTMKCRTRLVTLDQGTRNDAASDFYGIEFVPTKAITMGVSTILSANEIILMAWGEGKARIISRAVEGPLSDECPSTFLQTHDNALVVLDTSSAAELTRYKAPWLVMPCNWQDINVVKKAVCWLSMKVKKAILKLTKADYNENGLSELLAEFSDAYHINLVVFNHLSHTITGWPGGKPNCSDTTRPVKSNPYPKKVVIFSPHPDDDVISMGGTFIRLVEQKHDVSVAYQTSGNIAVSDADALRYLDFVADFLDKFNVQDKHAEIVGMHKSIVDSVMNRKPGQIDSPELLYIKGLIRKEEAKAACRYVGLKPEQSNFLELPFYETGKVVKKPLGPEDIKIMKAFLRKLAPHMIFAAGDLTDPHGTHRVCFFALVQALQAIKTENLPEDEWIKSCDLWLYRGAWQEWSIDEIEMAVPISPDELLKKRNAIFKHQSQKDFPMFPGNDKREFWMRAEDRNKATAELYNSLGFNEYEAMEAFVRYKF